MGMIRNLLLGPASERMSLGTVEIPFFASGTLTAAVRWYERLGFAKQWEYRFESGLPVFVEVARGGVRLFSSEHTGDARPDTLVYLRV